MDSEPVSELAEVQKALAQAAMKQPGDPLSFGISAYVNGLLVSCRVDALVDLYLNPSSESCTKQEAFDAAVIRAIKAKTEQLEANTARIQVAPADRRIVAAN